MQSDAAGNAGARASRTFTVDTTAPAVTLDAPAAGGQTPALATFAGAGGTAPGDAETETVTDGHDRDYAVRALTAVSALTRRNAEGANRVAFSGRVGKKALRSGRSALTLRAVDASGNRSVAKKVRFRVG